jgi:hypothetical protein
MITGAFKERAHKIRPTESVIDRRGEVGKMYRLLDSIRRRNDQPRGLVIRVFDYS